MKSGPSQLSSLDALALPIVDQVVMRALIDETGRILEASERFYHVLGQPSGTIQGKPIADFFDESVSETLRSGIIHALQTAGRWRGEICFKTPGNHKSWSEATLTALPEDDSRSLRLYFFLGFDVTERKAVEQALADTQKFSDALMREAPIAILMADEDGNCVYINDQWTALTGRRLRQALGRRWFEGVHREDQSAIAKAWEEMLSSGKPFQLEYRYVHSSKPPFSVWQA